MENQDPQWTNWNEQPQEENIPTWGDHQPQEQSQQNWGEPQPTGDQLDNTSWNWEEEQLDPLNLNTPSDFIELESNNWEQKTSILGLLPKLKIEALVYKFNYDDNKAIANIDLNNLEKLDNDGRYRINAAGNTELADILIAIRSIGESRGLKLHHSFLHKNAPNESTINISRGECQYNYIYFLKANHNSGDVVLDFSALNGPSEKVIDASNGILLLLPGWVPYSITKNLSGEDMIAISGRFIK